ncbi:MAG: DUF4872 domain-containing protein, partial [Planctomycetota bacterium]
AEDARGGQYHVVTVYGVDETKSAALVGDLADHPDEVPLDALAEARAAIKKQKNRLLWITEAPETFDLKRAVVDGVRACHDTLIGRGAVKAPGGKAMAKSFTLDAFETWAHRMHGSTDKESWATKFPNALNRWRGLTSIYNYIHYGTGGGLTRPLYAQFFREAHRVFGADLLAELAERYERLGEGWDRLGEAALPGDVDAFRRFQELSTRRAELTLSGGADAAAEIREILSEFNELEQAAAQDFPLSDDQRDALFADLKQRLLGLHRDEVDAHQRLIDVNQVLG